MNKKIITSLSIFGLLLAALVVGGLIATKSTQQNTISSEQTTAESLSQAAAFYDGKVIKWIIPYSPGGGYDEYVRLISPYMEEFTGARIDVINLPGAGGMRGVNELYTSPNNGLVIGIMNGSALIANELSGIKGAEYKLDGFEYLGRIIADPRILVLTDKSEIKTFEEFLDPQNPIKLGATGLGGSTYVDAVISKEAFNLDVEIIHGFGSSPVIRQSMLRGNIAGTWASWGSAEDGVDQGLEFPVLQTGRDRIPDLPDVPTVWEYVDRTDNPDLTLAILTAWAALIEVGRSVAAPPGTAAERILFLREAFYESLHNPNLLASAEQAGRPFDYATGEEMKKITLDATQMPPDIEELFIKAINGQL